MSENTKKQSPQSGNNTKELQELQQVLARLEKVEEHARRLENDNALLLKVADRHKIQRQMAMDGVEPTPKMRVRLCTYSDENGKDITKLVKGWGRMTKNHIHRGNMYDNEAQKTTVFFYDNTFKEMTYYDFTVTNDEKVEVDIIEESRRKGEDGLMHTFYTFEFDGETYEIQDTFIN